MVNEKKLQSRMGAVKRIARRAGYPLYKAEDISQQVAVTALKGRNIETQTNYQSFVDALREGSERAYNRGGDSRMPIYESSFENYSNFIDAIGCENDFDLREENKCDIYDLVCAIEKIKSRYRRILILYSFYGWTMVEVSKFERITESRVAQIVALSKQQIKKKVIQARLSQEKQTERKLKEYRTLSQEIQIRPTMEEPKTFQMAHLFKSEGKIMESFEVEEVSEGLCASF